MPLRLERILRASAEAHGLERGSKAWKAYVYGTMAKLKKGKKGKAENARG